MSLGLERAGMTTVAFCEIDPFCRKILKKHWPDVPVFEDLKELANEPRGTIPEFDIIAGGVPCQPFSVAGKQEGQQDDRHLWPFMFKIVKQQKPAFVLVENVAGFVSLALDDLLTDLESEGYASQSFVIPACSVDAKHRRDRVWVIAHANRKGEPDGSIAEGTKRRLVGYPEHDGFSTSSLTGSHEKTPGSSETKRPEEAGESEGTGGLKHDEDVADSNSKRRRSGNTERQNAKDAGQPSRRKGNDTRRVAAWEPEPRVGRVADGVPNRVDRIKGLGNAVVPQVVEVLGHAIMEEYYGP